MSSDDCPKPRPGEAHRAEAHGMHGEIAADANMLFRVAVAIAFAFKCDA
jgi:hypothetical protein